MPDDFIREPIDKITNGDIRPKHRILFRMSDIAQKRGLAALRDSLLAIFPLAVVSTVLYLAIMIADLYAKPDLIAAITSPPFDGKQFSPAKFLAAPYIAPYLIFCSLIPVFFSCAFTYQLSRHYKSGDSLPLSLISGAVTFVALYSPIFNMDVKNAAIYDFPLNLLYEYPGFLTGGVFLAAVISLVNYGLYRFLAGRGAVSPLPINVGEALQGGFRTVLPGLLTTFLVLAIVLLVGKPFGHQLYFSVAWITKIASDIYSLLIITILVNIFAFFGIQGSSSVFSIFWLIMLSASVDPPLWGDKAVKGDFATLSTIFFFVMIGGTGSTLSLNLAMLLARSEQVRKLAAMSFIPSLMNANEFIIYGLPLAFNRFLLVPFFLVPIVNIGISYAAFTYGIMRAPELLLPPYLPAPLGAFLACGADWYALAVCVINILVGMAIYSFFLSPYDLRVREHEDIPDEDARPRRTPL